MKITLVAPGRHIDIEQVSEAATIMEQAGFTVNYSAHLTNSYHYFSDSDEFRLSDLQTALDDAETDLILCARGGYGTIRLIGKLDFTRFASLPKPVIGFSDITVLHSTIQRLGLHSIHGAMPVTFANCTREALESLFRAMRGKHNRYDITVHHLNRKGKVTAPMAGGNLAVLSSLIGTPFEPDFSGRILFLEEVNEAVYCVERMLWQMKYAGKLEKIKGLVIGGMTGITDTATPFGQTVEEVIASMVSEYAFPVCFNFPAGHIADNRAIVLGKEATLDVGENRVIFSQ